MTTAKYNVWARHLTLLLSGLLFTTLSQAQSTVLINELDSVDADEFIELKGAPNASLNGYTLVLFASGSIATPADNKSYRAIALDGYHIRSTGYFVVGVQSAPNVDIVVMGAPLAASSLVGNVNSGNGFISNYFSAVALYSGVVTYPRGTPGAIASNVNLIDAVTHHPQRSVDKFLVATLTPGQLSINEHGEVFAYFQSIGRFPEVGAIANNTTSYRLLKPSSGMSNGIAPTFSTTGRSDVKMVFSFLTTVAPKAGIVNEGGISPTEGQVSKVTVKLQNKAGGVVIAPSDLAINVQSRDQSELVVQTAPIVIPAGKSSITFNLTAVPDGWKDGNQVVYFEATAPGCYDEQVAMTVKDVTAVQPVSPLIITEVNAREAGDANGDGAANEVDDQFIEIVNRSLATVDLSSKKLVVDGVDKFTFPAGSLLLAGRAAVVFADGVSNGIGQNGLVSGKDKFGCSLVFDAGLASGFGIDPSYGIVQIKGSSSVVVGAQISAAGTGYKAPVTVTFSGGGGSGAAGTATVVSGKITGLVITNAGSGYTSAPTITLAGATGSGTGAVATAVISDEQADFVYNPWGLDASLTYGPGSAVRGGTNPLISPPNHPQNHVLLAGKRCSPGLKSDGTQWSAGTFELQLSLSETTIAEAGEQGQSVLTVKRVGPTVGDLTVDVSSLLATQAIPASASIVISDGDDSATVDILPIRNALTTNGSVKFEAVDPNGCYNKTNTPAVTKWQSPTLTVVDQGSLTLALTADSIVESAGDSISTLTITRSASAAALSLEVRLRENPVGTQPPYTLAPDQITLSGASVTATADPAIYTVVMAIGETSVPIQVNPVNDSQPVIEDISSLEIAAIASPAEGSLNGIKNLSLVDNDGLLTGPVINEFESDSVGTDDHEYVELKADASRNMSAYVLVLLDNAGTAYDQYALTDLEADASGYFLVADAAVLNGTAPSSNVGYLLSEDLSINDGPAAIALYKNPTPGAALPLTNLRNNLLDVVVYGSGASATLLGLLPPGQSAVALPAADGVKVISRLVDGGAFRDSALFGSTSISTAGFSNTGDDSAMKAYLALFSETGAASADPDFDRLTNLTEYAFGMNPAGAYVPVPAGARLPEISANGKTITVYLGATAACDPHVQFITESSTDLSSWTVLDTNTGGSLGASFSSTYVGAADVIFLRARIEPVVSP